MKIKRFGEFNEAISGTELVGNISMGPAYGETRLQNKTVGKRHTTAEYSKDLNIPDSGNTLTSDIFFDDQYSDIYNQYLKSGGSQSELTDDRGLNMKIMMDFLRTSNS